MHVYFVIPMAACVCSAVLALRYFLDSGWRRVHPLALLLTAASFAAFGETLAGLAPDAESALFFLRLFAPGWVVIGPLAVHIAVELLETPPRRRRRILGALYAAAGGFLGLAWGTSFMLSRAVPTPWGWGYEPGPAFVAFAAFTLGCLGSSVAVLRRSWFRAVTKPERRSRARLFAIGVCPIAVGSVTDLVLPILHIQAPMLGMAAVAVFGVETVWAFPRFRYWFLQPAFFMRWILRSLPDGVAVVNDSGVIRVANRALGKLVLGLPEPPIGHRIQEYFPALSIDLSRDVQGVEVELEPPSGPRIPVMVATARLEDQYGLALGMVVVVRDLREVVALRNRLVTSGRLAAVGQLAAGIAHEVNNPLAFARTNLNLLLQEWADVTKELEESGERGDLASRVENWREMLCESLEGIDRAAAIVRDVRGFSHAGGREREFADLNALLDQVVRVTESQFPAIRGIEKRYGEIPFICCAPQQLKQVFLNLLVNAAQAVDARGHVRLVTESHGDWVDVRIEDDGCGIPADRIERIFDPFFTTKAVGEGTGLGLAISYEIVRRHGGEISVRSELGRGTVFRVRLPVQAPPAG